VNLNTRNRGIVAAHLSAPGNPTAVLTELTGAFNNFRQRNDAAIDDINAQLAAMKVGGLGISDDDLPSPAARTRAVAAVVDYMRRGDTSAMASIAQARGMSTDSDPDGGYTVPHEIDRVIQNQLVELSSIRRVANVVRTSFADYYKLIGRRGATSGWVGEKSERPATDTPTLASVKPPIGEIYAMPEITARLLDDNAFNLSEWLQENVSDEFALQEGEAFFTGNGIEKPRGFLTMPTASTDDTTRPLGTLQYVKSGVAADIFDATHNGIDVLIDLVAALSPAYRVGSSVGWMMNSAVAAKLRKLKSLGDTENYLWQESVIAGQPSRLLGFPVWEDEFMPGVGSNAFPIAFGNWKRGYTVVDRTELRLLRDPYTKKGWVRFYFTKRVGGSTTDTNAIKLLKCEA